MDRVHVTSALHERRERVFLVFAGIFLGCMTMLNILGITRFIHLGPLALAIGVLPYPLTFLCTDFISEFYGRRRAGFVVWVGLLLNVVVIAFLWLGHLMPGLAEQNRPQWLPEGSWNPPAWQTIHFDQAKIMPFGDQTASMDLFEIIFRCSRIAVFASMLAYVAAQFCDVYLFHFWKKLTKGKYLWIRNNGSTMISQLVDSTTVILVTFWGQLSSGERSLKQLLGLIAGTYLFKVIIAALDTIPFYIGVKYLSRYLRIDPTREHGADAEKAVL
jgi:uncharacterized PurR-regulated membrane protein YhhQ (DUF165 family)